MQTPQPYSPAIAAFLICCIVALAVWGLYRLAGAAGMED